MITAVVAVREGSQRCKQKNIRPFGDTNLLEMKLKNLKKVRQKIVLLKQDTSKPDFGRI